ncbi:MAG TPA: sigma-54 dependent transcriptional regulator, partial [Planctomycetota bacterium]|nr:sigma-54 dependent transcriptional regulator [Planctomycetota bacterium]
PADLIESELFGHEKGSFTGAHERKLGRFEQANGGTLFLDEVGDMPLAAQAKVLRVLEENIVQRVGASDHIPVNVRVVAATNKDLVAEVEAKTFREDLYYRLNVIPIHVPPLRERGQDVIELFLHFLSASCKKYQLPVKRLDKSAASWLMSATWPGNIRELRNFCERVALLVPEETLTDHALRGLGSREKAALGNEDHLFSMDNFEQFKESSERLYLLRKLSENDWNVKRTAELLGMQRSNIYKKIELYGLKGPMSE